MVHVGHEQQLPGYGGGAAKPPGWQDSPYQNYPGNGNGNGGTPGGIPDPSQNGGNGNGAGPTTPWVPGPFDPRGAFQIPNNFWGFVMLTMGLKT